MKINNATEFYNFISKLPSNEDFYDYTVLYKNIKEMCVGCKQHLLEKIQNDLNERYKKVVNRQKDCFKNFLIKNFEKEIEFSVNNEVFAKINVD